MHGGVRMQSCEGTRNPGLCAAGVGEQAMQRAAGCVPLCGAACGLALYLKNGIGSRVWRLQVVRLRSELAAAHRAGAAGGGPRVLGAGQMEQSDRQMAAAVMMQAALMPKVRCVVRRTAGLAGLG